MNLFKKKERSILEGVLISLVRDYDSTKNILEELISHGIDNSLYFKNPDYRKIFFIYLEMKKNNKVIMTDSFIDYVQKRFHSDFSKQKEILTPFIQAYNDPAIHSNPIQFEYYIWRFKEHLLQDYWNHIFKINETEKWKSNDLIERSFYIVDGFNELWEKIAKKFEKQTESTLKNELLERFENNKNGISTSCKTDLFEWDEHTGGFEKTELYIIAARPAMGKTSFAIAMAKRIIKRGKIVKLFSLEMTRKQLINRFIADEMQIDYQRLKRAQLSEKELSLALSLYEKYDNHPYLIIIEMKTNTMSEFNQKMKEIPGDCTIVDYLQLMKPDGDKRKPGNREQEIAMISGNLKQQAKYCNEAVIALSQLSRSVENRSNKRPQLSDLRESGAIEQDADVVIFLYRDAYYRKQEGKIVPEYEEGNLEVNIAKGREIPTGLIRMHLYLKNTTLEEEWRHSNN